MDKLGGWGLFWIIVGAVVFITYCSCVQPNAVAPGAMRVEVTPEVEARLQAAMQAALEMKFQAMMGSINKEDNSHRGAAPVGDNSPVDQSTSDDWTLRILAGGLVFNLVVAVLAYPVLRAIRLKWGRPAGAPGAANSI